MTNNTPTPLNCPTCGAPIDTDGMHAVVRCPFCGNTILVPGIPPSGVSASASAMDEIRQLVESEDLDKAVERYQQLFNVDLPEAKEAINALQAGRLAAPSAGGAHTPEELTQALREVQRLLAGGQRDEAIRLYCEVYGVNQDRAAEAVGHVERGLQEAEAQPRAGRRSRLPVFVFALAFVICVIGILSFVLVGGWNPLRANYYPLGPVAMLPTEAASSAVSGTGPDFITLLSDPGDNTRFFGLIDGKTGKLRWTTDKMTGDANASAIIPTADLVYIATGNNLLARRLSDGSVAWQAVMPDKLNYDNSNMLVTSDRVITSNADQSLQAYDTQTGQLVWSKRLSGYDRTLRLMGNSLVVIDTVDQDNNYGLVLLDPSSGDQQRAITPSCTHQGESYNALDPDSGLAYDPAGKALYLVSDSAYACVQRIDLASGQPAWQVSADTDFSFAGDGFWYLMTDSTLYFGNGGDLWAVDKSAGTMKALVSDPDYELLPLSTSGDQLIVRARRTRGTERFELWGVKAASGDRAWQLDLEPAQPIDPPNEMAGLVDASGPAWTWRLAPAGLTILNFQANPNQVVLKAFNPTDGKSAGAQQSLALKNISGDFYEIPSVIGWRDNVLYFSVESDIYALDLSTGKLTTLY